MHLLGVNLRLLLLSLSTDFHHTAHLSFAGLFTPNWQLVLDRKLLFDYLMDAADAVLTCVLNNSILISMLRRHGSSIFLMHLRLNMRQL